MIIKILKRFLKPRSTTSKYLKSDGIPRSNTRLTFIEDLDDDLRALACNNFKHGIGVVIPQETDIGIPKRFLTFETHAFMDNHNYILTIKVDNEPLKKLKCQL